MAQRFTVGTNYLSASANIPDTNTGACTTMAWVRIVSAASGTGAEVWRHSNFTFAPANHDEINFANFGFGLVLFANFSTAGVTASLASTGISANTWGHVATVRDGTAVRLYVNGSLADDDTNDNSSRTDPTTFDVCQRDNGGLANEIDVEGLKFFNRALTAEQIAVEMKRTMPVGPDAKNAWAFVGANGRDYYGSCPLTLTGTLGASADPQVGVQFRAASTDVMVWLPVAGGSNTTIEVPAASLTIATFAPRIDLGVIPATIALATTPFVPVIDLGVIPPTAALALETFAPTVTATGNIVVTPPPATLTTSLFAPVIDFGIVVPKIDLTTSTFAPRIDLGVVVPVATLTTTTFAPVVGASITVDVPLAELVLTSFAPSIFADRTVTVPTAELTIGGSTPGVGEGFAPTVASSEVIAVETCSEWEGGLIGLNHGDQFYFTIDGPSITGVMVRVVIYAT